MLLPHAPKGCIGIVAYNKGLSQKLVLLFSKFQRDVFSDSYKEKIGIPIPNITSIESVTVRTSSAIHNLNLRKSTCLIILLIKNPTINKGVIL